MNTHADKTQDNKSQSAANERSQKQSSDKSTFQFVDNRPEVIVQRKLQVMASNNPQAVQLKFLQNMAHNSHPSIQRKVNVFLGTNDDNKKSLSATGTVKDFKGGSTAGAKGWVGVTKYRAHYQIDSVDGKYQDVGEVGPLQNSFTNPEAGHVLAKQNGGNGADPENIFAQDGGTNNSKYKSFEGDMRRTMNKYKKNDKVSFKCYLVGDNIEKGTITDAGLSDASSISSDEEGSSSDESMSTSD